MQARFHLDQLVINMKHGTAGIAENGVDAFPHQRFQQNAGAAHRLRRHCSGGMTRVLFRQRNLHGFSE
jgi:hypothetical protein